MRKIPFTDLYIVSENEIEEAKDRWYHAGIKSISEKLSDTLGTIEGVATAKSAKFDEDKL